MSHTRYITIAAAALAALAVASLASAQRLGPPGQWTKLSTAPASNTFRAGLARTGDGVLHVAWPAKNGTKEDIWHASVSPTGAAGAPNAIASAWAGVQNPDLVVHGGNLRAFFGGHRSTLAGETNTSLNTATAPPTGASWTVLPGRVAQSTDAYAASVGAGFAADGTPITAFATSGGLGLRFHYGLTPSTPDNRIPAKCCQYDPEVALDAGSGETVLGWFSNEDDAHGLYAQTITPSGAVGERRYVPGSATADRKSAVHPGQRTAITGRLGAAGVYVASGAGYPTYRSVNLWRYGSDRPAIVLRAPGAKNVSIAPAPAGRLWLMWRQDDALYATRTNMAATRVGPLTKVAAPQRASSIWSVQGEGSLGRLDLVVNAGSGSDLGFWHQQVLPRLTLAVSVERNAKRKTSTATFVVRDAGDPVPAARVAVGGRTATTNAAGRATLTFSGTVRPYRAAATKADYAPAQASFRG